MALGDVALEGRLGIAKKKRVALGRPAGLLDRRAVRPGPGLQAMKLVHIGWASAVTVVAKGCRLCWAMWRSIAGLETIVVGVAGGREGFAVFARGHQHLDRGMTACGQAANGSAAEIALQPCRERLEHGVDIEAERHDVVAHGRQGILLVGQFGLRPGRSCTNDGNGTAGLAECASRRIADHGHQQAGGERPSADPIGAGADPRRT